MRIFVFEFVTGGGMTGAPLPPALVHEADLMIRALLRDLSIIPGVHCFTTRDARLPSVPGVEALAGPDEDPFALYARGLGNADAAWPTAPETGGALERLGRLTLAEGRVLLGSHPDAVRLAASKRATAAALQAAGVDVVPTYRAGEPLPEIKGPWVVKPDDGAGSEDTTVVADAGAARAALRDKGTGFVAQPWIDGEALSLSLLCAGGEARLLSCNRQRVRLTGGRVSLAGIAVNAEAARARRFIPLAGCIAGAIPGLWGHVGVDLIMRAEGPVVLEVNPRLTTSYCGLGRALGMNPALPVLELARTGRLPELALAGQGRAVELDLEGAGAR